MDTPDHSSTSKFKLWEEAESSLISAVNGYRDMCLDLGANLPPQKAQSGDLISKINTSLELVRTRLSHTLQESVSILARARNNLVSPLHNLPQEVLLDIFIPFVFSRSSPKESHRQSMRKEVWFIHRRLYTLMGVCTAWKDVLMSGGVFWSVIPMVESSSPCANMFQPLELSLRRAGGSRLHLAAGSLSGAPLSELSTVLALHGPRFHTINISLFDPSDIQDAINSLLQHNSPRSLYELSIQCTSMSNLDWIPGDDKNIVPRNHPLHNSFANMMKALTIFRICGAYFHWDTLSFSNRLVELRVENITLGYDDSIASFGRALSSAPSLRDLYIISLITFQIQHSTPNTRPLSSSTPPVKLLALQSLHLQHIYLNTLEILLPMIAHGSYYTSLLFTHRCISIKILNNELDEQIGIDALCDVMRHTSVDTLMIDGYTLVEELTIPQLSALLKATPTLKTLKMHHFHFDGRLCETLVKKKNSLTQSPALRNLHLTSAQIYDEQSFREMIASYPLHQVTLGGTLHLNDQYVGEKIREDSSVVQWIREKVSDLELRLVEEKYYPPEFKESITWVDMWPLW